MTPLHRSSNKKRASHPRQVSEAIPPPPSSPASEAQPNADRGPGIVRAASAALHYAALDSRLPLTPCNCLLLPYTTPMINCVFWDSDNTLVDTANHHWRKHAETLKRCGIVLDEKHRARIYTNNGAQNWDWLTAELGLKMTRQDYLDAIDAWYAGHIDAIEIRPGVTDAIALFAARGMPQAVVSNGRRRSVMAALTAKALTSRFEFILCKEDYEGHKPDPAPYLAALKKMEALKQTAITPADCLAIEDDPKGVASARAAGMQVIHRPPGADDPDAFLALCRQHLTA